MAPLTRETIHITGLGPVSVYGLPPRPDPPAEETPVAAPVAAPEDDVPAVGYWCKPFYSLVHQYWIHIQPDGSTRPWSYQVCYPTSGFDCSPAPSPDPDPNEQENHP